MSAKVELSTSKVRTEFALALYASKVCVLPQLDVEWN